MSAGLMEIPLEKVEIGPYQARSKGAKTELESLKMSIQKLGLLYPIIVYREDDKYKTLDGQRRYMVFEELGKSTIPAIVVPKPIDELMAKAMSYTATQRHLHLEREDAIDVVTALFDSYNDVKKVAEEYGLSEAEVRDLVGIGVVKSKATKLWGWYEERRDEKGAVDTTLRALKATRAPDGSIDEEKAVELAGDLFPLLKEQQEEAVKVAREDPSLSKEEIVTKAKQAPVNLSTTVSYDTFLAFEKKMKEKDIPSRSKGVERAIEDWIV